MQKTVAVKVKMITIQVLIAREKVVRVLIKKIVALCDDIFIFKYNILIVNHRQFNPLFIAVF